MTRVLFIKIGAIGDVVMALSVLDYLKEENLTWVVGKGAFPLLEKLGDKMEVIPIDEEKLLRGSFREKIFSLFKIWRRLGFRSFDLVLTGHRDRRYGWISRWVRARERRSFEAVPGRYHGDEYVRLLTGNDVGPQKRFCNGFSLENRGGIILAPGGAKNVLADDAQRRWPVEYYVTLAKALIERGNEVVLTGAASDAWVLPAFEGLGVVNRIGELSLVELLEVYARAEVVVTHDSGPLHLARLVDAPVVALFGPTNPFEKTVQSDKLCVLWGGEHLACRPCYDGKRYASCQRNECMWSLQPEFVLQKVLMYLKTKELISF